MKELDTIKLLYYIYNIDQTPNCRYDTTVEQISIFKCKLIDLKIDTISLDTIKYKYYFAYRKGEYCQPGYDLIPGIFKVKGRYLPYFGRWILFSDGKKKERDLDYIKKLYNTQFKIFQDSLVNFKGTLDPELKRILLNYNMLN